MHFDVSMHYISSKFTVSRWHLFVSGVLRPAIVAVPSALPLPYWWRDSNPELTLLVWPLWGVATLFLAWNIGLDASERQTLPKSVLKRISPLIKAFPR
jgi:hypothetical protein